MGSDRHYPEEAPARRVAVAPFRIDPAPVTNRQFRAFVEATGYLTYAEIPPDPKHYPRCIAAYVEGGIACFYAAVTPCKPA
jgi:sulfatase modifying factor 1